MPDVDISVNIDVYCAKCGAPLCGQTSVSSNRRGPVFSVDPCEKCLNGSYNEGYEEGYDVADKNARET